MLIFFVVVLYKDGKLKALKKKFYICNLDTFLTDLNSKKYTCKKTFLN